MHKLRGLCRATTFSDLSRRPPMQIAEQDIAPDTIEATVNYLNDSGVMPFTYTGGPGSLDVRTGGTPDPRRVVMRDGRTHARDFALGREGFCLVRHGTPVVRFLDEAELR